MRAQAAAAASAMAAACATMSAQPHSLENAPAFRLVSVRGLDEFVPVPENNPLTLAKVRLGERLFFERRLSGDGSMSCASCHRPEHGFADTAALSRGARGKRGRRNTPSLLNRAYGTAFFWDGRAESLEDQALEPIRDTLELDLPADRLIARLTSDALYRRAFGEAFPEGVTSLNVARALASYVRTLRSGNAPVDRYRDGDTLALTPEARRGLALFSGSANCTACHVGPTFTDERFHNTGVAAENGDPGRYAVTGWAADRGAFKTPTLREVSRTAPYMHDGSLPTLQAVIDFYDRGGAPDRKLDPEIRPLHLTLQEKRELLAFLRAVDGTITKEAMTHAAATDLDAGLAPSFDLESDGAYARSRSAAAVRIRALLMELFFR